MRTIYILWLRQLKRFIRKKASLIGALGQPIIFLVAFGFGLSPLYAKAGQGNYIQFIGPGIVAMTILFSSVFTGIEITWDKQFGFLKETFVAPVSRLEIFVGKTFGGMTVALIQGLLVFAITFIAGFRIDLVHVALLPLAALYLLMISYFFASLGSAIAARLDDMQSFPIIFNFVIQPLFYLSGALFPIAGLPKVLGWITKINPLSYGIDGMRFALGGAHYFSPLLSFVVLAAMCVIVTLVGIYQFNKIEL